MSQYAALLKNENYIIEDKKMAKEDEKFQYLDCEKGQNLIVFKYKKTETEKTDTLEILRNGFKFVFDGKKINFMDLSLPEEEQWQKRFSYSTTNKPIAQCVQILQTLDNQTPLKVEQLENLKSENLQDFYYFIRERGENENNINIAKQEAEKTERKDSLTKKVKEHLNDLNINAKTKFDVDNGVYTMKFNDKIIKITGIINDYRSVEYIDDSIRLFYNREEIIIGKNYICRTNFFLKIIHNDQYMEIQTERRSTGTNLTLVADFEINIFAENLFDTIKEHCENYSMLKQHKGKIFIFIMITLCVVLYEYTNKDNKNQEQQN
jgi:hypothetical protein